jgi:hypothetical protein
MGRLDEYAMNRIDQALQISFGLGGDTPRGARY